MNTSGFDTTRQAAGLTNGVIIRPGSTVLPPPGMTVVNRTTGNSTVKQNYFQTIQSVGSVPAVLTTGTLVGGLIGDPVGISLPPGAVLSVPFCRAIAISAGVVVAYA